MDLPSIIYSNVQESFGMGGPYLGNLSFNGILFKSKFIADSEKLSDDKSKIILCKYSNNYKSSFLLTTKRSFHIIVFNLRDTTFYQSKKSYKGLAIQSFINNEIIFHEAFHCSIKKFERKIIFNNNNFIKISKSNL